MRARYPVCAGCSITMNPAAFDDVTPGFRVNDEVLCPECFKDYIRDMVDSSPASVARAMDIEILDIQEG